MNYKYVKTDKKRRLDKNIYLEEQVKNKFFGDYGRIVPPGYIVFDFDEQPYIDIMYKIITNLGLKCKMLITTKGIHFMFKTALPKVSDHIKEYNWLGIKCDVKACGIKEYKESYQAIRVNGKDRKEQYMNGATTDDDLDIAPKWLYIVPKKKNQIDLTEDQTGGRNNLFHSELMIKAKKEGFSYDEYCEMAHIINNYVLPNPIEENELNTAIRQEEWDNLYIEKEKQLLLDMALDIINYWGCLWANEQISFFNHNENRYDTNEIVLKGYLQEKYQNENIRTSQMKEVIEQVNIHLQNRPDYYRERNAEYILCGNELVSMLKDDVIPNTRKIYTDIYYPYKIMSQEEFTNFNGRAKSFMNEISCNNQEILTIIWECIGCMLSPTKPFGKFFIWYGSGANGKSLLLKLIKLIMGDFMTHANILSINDKFALQGVIRGICNVTDDVGITTLKETGNLKSIIDGSDIEVNRKFNSSIWWKPNSQFVICCNDIPKIQDTSKGMIRRLAFIPFEMQLKKENIDINLEMTLKSDIDNIRYILTGAIFAYRQAIKRRKFDRNQKTKRFAR